MNGTSSLLQPYSITHSLVPSVDRVAHDHNYCHKSDSGSISHVKLPIDSDQPKQNDMDVRTTTAEKISEVKSSLSVANTIRCDIELKTRQQSATKEWHYARVRRITSSICGQILTQKKKTVALLCRSLYPKPLDPLPPPMAWGRQNEQVACDNYRRYMTNNGHCGLTTNPCGFIMHRTKGWLGASPDAKVYDPSCNDSNGIVEFKCPYSKRDKSPQDLCQDHSFYCELFTGTFHLKRNHNYYHQVQLQLYVGGDMFSWCDFCVYTPVDVAVERIYPCKEWQSTCIPKLEEYYDKYIIPEILDPLYKPSYIW